MFFNPPSQQFRRGLTLALSLAVLAIAGCGKDDPGPMPEVIRPAKVMQIAGSGVTAQQRFPATVQAARQIDLSFPISGQLVALTVMEGQHVHSGESLGHLDTRNFRDNLKAAEAANAEAQINLKDGQEMMAKDRIAKPQLDKLEADAAIAEANVAKARKSFSDTQLRAPFSGRIGRRYTDNFAEVQARQPIASLFDVTSLELVIEAPESLVSRARAGRPPNLIGSFEAVPGREFPLTIKQMASAPSAGTDSYRVTLSLVIPDDVDILPGMAATVIATRTDQQDAATGSYFVIPAYAVSADEVGKPRVWVVDDADHATVHPRPVVTGKLTGQDKIRITDGLKFGETIVIGGVSRLREGMKIRPVTRIEF